MERQITEKEVKEFFIKRDEEISKALMKTQSELSKSAREMSGDDERLIGIAAQSQLALYKALEETRDLVQLCFGTVSMYTKPFYCRHLKLIASAMEAPGADREYFEDTTNLLNAAFKSEAISMSVNQQEKKEARDE